MFDYFYIFEILIFNIDIVIEREILVYCNILIVNIFYNDMVQLFLIICIKMKVINDNLGNKINLIFRIM